VQVWATATEDMDALTFGTPMLLRHLTFAETRKMPIVEVHLDKVLSGLGLSMDQFIDLCILCGCDYCDAIRGIGPKRALDLIQKHGCIEEALKHLDKEKHPLPLNFNFEEVRRLFRSPDVADPHLLDVGASALTTLRSFSSSLSGRSLMWMGS
jgi:flap endonuclease-1